MKSLETVDKLLNNKNAIQQIEKKVNREANRDSKAS